MTSPVLHTRRLFTGIFVALLSVVFLFGLPSQVAALEDCPCVLSITNNSDCNIEGTHVLKENASISLLSFIESITDPSVQCVDPDLAKLALSELPHGADQIIPAGCLLQHVGEYDGFAFSMTCEELPPSEPEEEELVEEGECNCHFDGDVNLAPFPEKTTQASCDGFGDASTEVYEGKEVTGCAWTPKLEEDAATTGSSGSGSSGSGSTSQPGTASNYTVDTSDYKMPAGYDGPLPECAFDGSCRNVNDLLRVAIKGGEIALGFIGTFALAFFVYGGFMMIISMGNAERVKKGRDILVAAVVGIVITFSAYALVNFILDALAVSSGFRLIN